MKTPILIMETFRKFWWLFVRDVLLMVGESLIGAVALISIAPVVDAFLSSAPHEASLITSRMAVVMRAIGLPTTLGGFLTVFLTFQLLKCCVAIFVRHKILKTRQTVIRDLMLGTFQDCFNTQWTFFSSRRQGAILSILLYDMGALWSGIGAMTGLLVSLIQVVCYLAVPMFISWQVTSISLATALLLAIPFQRLGKASYRLGMLSSAGTNQLTTVIQEHLNMAKVILGFGNQQKSLHGVKQVFDPHSRVLCRFQALQAATPLIYELWGAVVLIVTVFAGQRFGMSLSEGAILLWTLRNCIPLLGSLTAHRNVVMGFVPSVEQITHLRQQARELRQPSGRRVFSGFQKGIAVEQLTFAYPAHEPLLRDVHLYIPKGKMVALVGRSGVGKSTLIDLLMGFLQPTAGHITFDGVPLQEFDIISYRQRIGYVPQDSVLFNTTIRENLRWAMDSATDAQIREACRQANADEFIERFSDGYDTVVGDRGVRLSGGQCQRVALARAILRKPDLLILDEATSSLDTHSERLIQQAIETVAKETTVVVIAHRLSTIVNADYIYVLDLGRIVEEGAYQDLVNQDGHFSRMTQEQLLEAPV